MNTTTRLGLLLTILVGVSTGVPRALDRPQPPSPVRDYIHSLDVEPAAHYRNLVVFPLVSSRGSHPNVLNLDQAVRSGALLVREIGEGEVNDLAVENVGKVPVFIMAGEILEGAKQTRVLQSDVLVPPHSGRLDIGAFCVEHGRWSYQGEDRNFSSGGLISNPAVRAKAQSSHDQSEVWAEVDATHRRLQVPETTGAITEAYRAPRVQQDIGPYVQALEDLPEREPRMTGAVVMVGRRILCADGFGAHVLLANLWPKLIRSYALEAVADGGWDEVPSANPEIATAFLRRVDDARLDKQSTPGMGWLVDVEGPTVSGSALVHDEWPLHVSLFPRNVTSVRPDDKEDEAVPALQRSYPR